MGSNDVYHQFHIENKHKGYFNCHDVELLNYGIHVVSLGSFHIEKWLK